MTSRARCAVVVLAALALGCSDVAPPTSVDRTAAIVNGTPTGSAYGAVGALLFDWNKDGALTGDDQICTGTLVSPTVFVTAAHCVHPDAFIPADAQFYVSFDPDLFASTITTIPATSAVWDPEYGTSQAALHDLAVVTLPAGATSGITPLHLPPAGALDRMAAHNGLRGRRFVNVGYGLSASYRSRPTFDSDGKRQMSTAPFMALQPTWLGLLTNPAATGQGGDCYGDSGGPKFLEGDPTTVYATVVTGDVNCRATTWDWRLDTPEARGFLGGFVTLP